MARLFRKYLERNQPVFHTAVDPDIEDMLLLDPMVLAEVNSQLERTPHRGSVFGRKVVLQKRQEADERLGTDYFNADSVYDHRAFRRA